MASLGRRRHSAVKRPGETRVQVLNRFQAHGEPQKIARNGLSCAFDAGAMFGKAFNAAESGGALPYCKAFPQKSYGKFYGRANLSARAGKIAIEALDYATQRSSASSRNAGKRETCHADRANIVYCTLCLTRAHGKSIIKLSFCRSYKAEAKQLFHVRFWSRLIEVFRFAHKASVLHIR